MRLWSEAMLAKATALTLAGCCGVLTALGLPLVGVVFMTGAMWLVWEE